MKVPLRILAILTSIAILIYAALPPPEPDLADTAADDKIEDSGAPATTTDPSLIRDFLGGSQLDAGRKAQDTLKKVNQSRQETMDEMEIE